ncbi:MAG: metallophosphoesterase [Sphingobacteriaceae bacterium]|nr:metallophosphoesterase [Sphingobacteriaceae bacterium]
MRRVSFLPVIVIVLIALLLDWYVFQGVKALSFAESDKVQRFVYLMFWTGSVSLLAAFVFNFYKAIPTGKFTLLFNIVFNAFLTIFITKLVFVLVLFFEDLYRIGASVLAYYPPRSTLVSQVALLLAAIPFFSFLFGVTRGKYHYKVRRTIVYLDDLPSKFEGFTITQISDVHSGSLDSVKGVQRGIDLINAQQSDLFVFTGDLVNNQASEIEPWIDIFGQIKAKAGKFSILGNHDYGDYMRWDSPEEKAQNLMRLKDNHRKLGFRLLLDENVVIEKEGQSIVLLGVENWGLGFGQRGNLNKALAGVRTDSVKLLLSHDPSHWDAEVKKHPAKIHLTLSGHTHGMQFGIELFGFKWSPVKYRYPNWAGLASENGRYLYVNRGFGFLGFAGRVGIWPEITVIELRKAVE